MRWIKIILIVMAVSACGRKGPLYLPDTEPASQAIAQPYAVVALPN